jgi:predicted ribosome quality control (RQC) complex YloA/Tae2 family protein
VDNLVLIRVAADYRQALTDAVVQQLREEEPHRFRLVVASADRRHSVLISLDPAHPWIGRPTGRWRPPKRSPSPFTAMATRVLRGAVVVAVEKPLAERRLTIRFADGRSLVTELVPHRANLVLVGPSGRIDATARRPSRKQRARLKPGESYGPAPLPPKRVDPFGTDRDGIRSRIRSEQQRGASKQEALAHGFVGLGRVGIALLCEEAHRTGRDLADLVKERLSELLGHGRGPVIETEDDPMEAAATGRLEPDRYRILPWNPPWDPEAGMKRLVLDDASATAGLFHEALERAAVERRRAKALAAILDRETRRLREVELKVAADLEAFESPERFRHWGEALLAGLSEARRAGDHLIVPDPYDAEGSSIPIPVAPGQSPTRAAEGLFARHRRAQRGLERARERAAEVARRRIRLERLAKRHAGRSDPDSADELEKAMQHEGIPVGLERVRGGPRSTARPTVPRIEGVRLFLSRDGDAVLVGKSGKGNDRLSFKLASPEDFWLHARGVPGAHVVVRNDRRESKPSPSALTEAAEAAAWFSEAREDPRVDVQWTRRKYVRRLRGAPPGTVTVKRSQTVRVRPRCPPAFTASR